MNLEITIGIVAIKTAIKKKIGNKRKYFVAS
jgi:hypothetical protein